MEWDQIADRWVAMTKRLCSDSIAGPRTIDRLKTTGRTPKGTDRKQVDKMPPEIAGNDHSMSSNE